MSRVAGRNVRRLKDFMDEVRRGLKKVQTNKFKVMSFLQILSVQMTTPRSSVHI